VDLFMDIYIAKLANHLTGIIWEGPAMFGIISLTILAIFRQWHILLITIFSIVVGWGGEDLIIMNISTEQPVVTIPFLSYCSGSFFVVILLFITFLKASIK
jgi:hypothetical protein